jgi:hypothetical protein
VQAIRPTDAVIAWHHQQDRVRIFSHHDPCCGRNGGRRGSHGGLDKHERKASRMVDLLQFVLDAGLLHRVDEHNGASEIIVTEARQGVLEQGILAAQGLELLGLQTAGQRPKACARAAAENDGTNWSHGLISSATA